MGNSFAALSICAVALFLNLGLSATAKAQTIENKDVFVLADQLADEVELIRAVMGRPYDDSPRLPVSQALQYEVYFQAQTLFRKANQLAREIAAAPRRRAAPAPERDIEPADVYGLIEGALEQVMLVKNELGIEEQVQSQERQASISATGIFLIIIDINRQLNLLTSEAIRPADVYEEVSFAIVYAAALLANRGIENLLPEVPFENYKRPADVYGLLLECIEIVSEFAPKVGGEVLGVSSRRNVPDDIEPGHVYDIARILAADLAHLASVLDVEEVYPGLGSAPKHVFPSHVFQRASVLQSQLLMLDDAL